MNQLDKPETNKEPINQFDEQASEKSSANNVMNKRALMMIVSVLVVLLLSYAGYDYFIKTNISDNNNTSDAHLYQNVLAAHLKVNNLNSPVAKTKHSDQSKQVNQINKAKHSDQTKQVNQINKAKQSNQTKKSNKTKQQKIKRKKRRLRELEDQRYQTQRKINRLKAKTKKQEQAKVLAEKKRKIAQEKVKEAEKQKQAIERQRRDEAKKFKVEQGQQNTQRSLGQLKHSIEQFIDKINALLKQQANKQTKPILVQQTNTAVFELVDISLWDSKPQATIQYQGKMSIVDKGSVRVGWKIVNIDFDKEQISIVHAKNRQQITLKRIR